MLALALLSIWLPSSLAVSVGLYYTHDIKCLWFLLIPTLVSVKYSTDKDDKKGDAE